MADDIYDLRPQLLYGGAWQDVPLHDDRSVSIVRGRVDEFAEPTHSATAVVADNRGGDYHPRNPTSPLYGVAGRNTPVRLVGDELVFEDFEDADSSLTVGPDYGEVAPWYRVATDAHSGGWCWRSGVVGDGQQSWVDVEVPYGAGCLEFWWRLSAGPTDSIVVWVDDGSDTWPLVWRVYGTGATTGWQRQSIDVSGQVWATIGYVRGEGAPAGEDCAYVDDVRFAQVRWAGEVAQWSPERTGDFDPATGRGDAWCGIAGAGILRRLSQGTPPTQSALYRTIMAAGPVAYWPLEDGFAADLAASPIQGCQPARVFFAPGDEAKMGSNDSLIGSRPLPTLPTSSGEIVGDLPTYVDTGEWVCGFFIYVSHDVLDVDLGVAVSMETALFTVRLGEGDIDKWQLRLFYQSSPRVATAYLHAFQGVTEILPDLSVIPVDMPLDQWVFVTIKVTDGGSYQSWQFSLVTADGVGVGHSNTVTATAGAPTGWYSGYLFSFGHIAFFDNLSLAYLSDAYKAMVGWPGETAAERLTRLCAEQGVPLSVVGEAPELVGPQWPDTFVNWLTEIERTDGGLLYEPRDQAGLAYRTRASLYAQEPKLILDWAQGQVAPPFQPTLDDQATRNDITVTRRNGSSARAVRDSGPMSTLPPPDGVGRVETEIRVNPATDDMLPGLASWALHLGTVEDVRWPQVTVDLDACPELAAAASAVDIGDLIRIVHTPLDVSPDDIDLIVLGYTETIEPRRRRIMFNCRPGSAWRVGRWDAFRWDSATSTLDTAVDATQTSLPVAVADGVWWTTDPASWPFDVDVGGERMTVAAVSAPVAGVQTMAVTRSVNGVVKPHAAGASVHVWNRGRWAL